MPATLTASREVRSESRVRRRTALELYLKDIAYNELITPQQEVALAKRIRVGDRKSLEQMVESNLRFVITIAKEYQGRGLPLEDLIAEGNLGLVRAVTRLRRDGRCQVHDLRGLGGSVRASCPHSPRKPEWSGFPSTRSNIFGRLERVASDLKQKLGREPSVEEIGQRADMQPRQVQDLLDASRWHISLDTPLEEGLRYLPAGNPG